MNKKNLLALVLLVVGGGLITMSFLNSKESGKDQRTQIQLKQDDIQKVTKKVRTKKFSDASLSQIPMNSKKRKDLLDGKSSSKEKSNPGQTQKQEKLEKVGSLLQDKINEQKESDVSQEDPQVGNSGGTLSESDDSLNNDGGSSSGDSNVVSNNNNESIVSQESEITVETDGRQLLIERKFAGDILECSGQTSWDNHHLYHPIPSGSRINIICETTSGFVIVDSSLDNL